VSLDDEHCFALFAIGESVLVRNQHCLKRLVASLVAFTVLVGACLGADIEAISRPSKDVVLSFIQPGQVREVLVKDGDPVRAEQVLVRLDDEVEQAELATLKAQAEDVVRIDAARAQLDQSKVDLKVLRWAADRGASTELEVQHAVLEVLIKDLSLKVQEFNHKQDQRKYEEARLRVERMVLKSPLDGRAEQVFVEKGESIQALKEVILVVDVDPLWVDAAVPIEQARKLKLGQISLVKLSGQDAVEAPITHIASVADAASSTLTVRVEVPNPKERPAGEHVWVSFPSSEEDKEGEASRTQARESAPRETNRNQRAGADGGADSAES
jgi:RND family efflux transporter MFP subunit